MKLKTEYLKKLINNTEKISFWVDYLRIKINDIKSKLIKLNKSLSRTIDYDNSNIITFDCFWYDLTAQKIRLSNWTWLIYTYSYFWVSIPIFIIIEYDTRNKELFNSWGKLDFYWQYFRLFELWEFWENYFFNEYIQKEEITRIDFRIDFFNYKNKIIDKDVIKSRKNSRLQTYTTNWYINSWKYWNSINKTVVVRWYDKKLDITKKWKLRLYWDYFDYENIFRLEWEFLNQFCRSYNMSKLDLLLSKCKKYIWLEKYDWEKYFTPYRKLDLSNEFEKMKYCRVMQSYIKEALKNWVDVYNYIDKSLLWIWFNEEDVENMRFKKDLISNYF
jgi:hypothetical protein